MEAAIYSEARSSGLSKPTIAYLMGLLVGIQVIFSSSGPETIKFNLGKMLLALALATLPQLVLGRTLNWRSRDHVLQRPFALGFVLGEYWQLLRRKPLKPLAAFTPLEQHTFTQNSDMGFELLVSWVSGTAASTVLYILTLLPWDQL